MEEITVPSAILHAANSPGDPVADMVVGVSLGHTRHHRQDRAGTGQRLHLPPLVHAQHHGVLGRVRIEAEDVEDLLHEERVRRHSLKPPARCGFSSKVRQIRPILDFDRAEHSAIEARDQAVGFFRVCTSAATTTASAWSTMVEGGRPGRGWSTTASSRS
jgi:hypothetical protein